MGTSFSFRWQRDASSKLAYCFLPLLQDGVCMCVVIADFVGSRGWGMSDGEGRVILPCGCLRVILAP